MPRFVRVVLLVAIVCAAGVYAWRAARRTAPREISNPVLKAQHRDVQLRVFLLNELQPIALTNCDLQRFGEANDGGYLLCANLLGDVKAGYSYGISGYDGWGCEVSRRLSIPVHEYDCFDLHEPVCTGGDTRFHGECVAGTPSKDKDGRVFETPEHQFATNGDAAKRLVVKMDV
jgi:hypothetical protein